MNLHDDEPAGTDPGEPDAAGWDVPLTSKEGWRRFVDQQPHPPTLHDPAALARLSDRARDQYDQDRQAYHADLPLANTPTIQKVIGTARLLIQLNRRQVSARRGLIVSGESGTGKTTALTQLGRTHELRTAFDAVLTGFLLCGHLGADRAHEHTARHEWDRRAELLIPTGTELATFSASRVFATDYPRGRRPGRGRRLTHLASDSHQQSKPRTGSARRGRTPSWHHRPVAAGQ